MFLIQRQLSVSLSSFSSNEIFRESKDSSTTLDNSDISNKLICSISSIEPNLRTI